MKKSIIIIIVSLGLFSISQAQVSNSEKSDLLLSVIFKLEKMRADATADIQKCESAIQKCDKTISNSGNIIKVARENRNVEAEKIASDAMARAKAAKEKNSEMKKSSEENQKRVELALATVKNEFSKSLSNPQKIKSVITNYSGRVSIQKKNGEHFTFEKNQKSFLETGDEVSTYENSSIDLQFLDGRGTMNIGPYSQVKIEEDEAGTQVMNMIKGQVNFNVEKLENYQATMEEKINAYKEDLKTVKDEFKKKMVDEYDSIKKHTKEYITKKFEVRTPACAVAVRATQFLVYNDEEKGTELIVIEGSVEMKGIKEGNTIIVNAGYKAIVTKDGILSDPKKIDLTTIERWWEK
ncbi:MAG: FecR family protein [Bacteroidia bacterium]|nr:FecR family protein [Bacteroidia bacterium]